MKQCDICGNKSHFHVKEKCSRCGRIVCYGRLTGYNDYGPQFEMKCFHFTAVGKKVQEVVCKICADEEEESFRAQVERNEVIQNKFGKNECPICGGRIVARFNRERNYYRARTETDLKIKDKEFGFKPGFSDPVYYCSKCQRNIDGAFATLRIAEEAEMARRYEDAAKIYEQLRLFEKARDAREKGKSFASTSRLIIKSTSSEAEVPERIEKRYTISLEEIKYERSEFAPKHGPFWYMTGSRKWEKAADEKMLKKAARKYLPSSREAIRTIVETYGLDVHDVVRAYLRARIYKVPEDKLERVFREAALLKFNVDASLKFDLEKGNLVKHYKFKRWLQR